MRRSFLKVVLFGLCSGLFAQTAWAEKYEYARYVPYPKASATNKLAQRGEYIAKLGDCAACHTSTEQGSRPFAGGLGIKTPFGTFYTPNLTPDKETGIGSWTDEQFWQALHHGKSPQGYLFPVFPYPYYTKITRDDAKALKAYLSGIPAVRSVNKKHDVPFPFNVRFLQLGWRILFFKSGEYQPNPKQTAEWNRGAYLVQGLAHCGMCHTPLNKLGAAKNDYFLGGGNFIDGFYAPDITSRRLKNKTVEELVAMFRTGKNLNGGKVQGPMKEMEHNSVRHFSDADLRAVAVYLKTVKSKPVPTAKVAVSGASGAEAGKSLYESKCAICHNTGAAGAPKLGDVAAWTPRFAQGMDTIVKHAIHGIGSMPAKGTCSSCTDNQIKEAVLYIESKIKGKAEGPKKAPAPRKPTIAWGKEVYAQHCSTCHTSGQNGAPKLGDKAAWSPILQHGLDNLYTHTIRGHGKMPARGGCAQCSDAELIAAVKYMAQESKQSGDYRLW